MNRVYWDDQMYWSRRTAWVRFLELRARTYQHINDCERAAKKGRPAARRQWAAFMRFYMTIHAVARLTR